MASLLVLTIMSSCVGIWVVNFAAAAEDVGNCQKVFEAKKEGEMFLGSCDPLRLSCTENTLLAVRDDCYSYYQCAIAIVYKCPCPDGTEFDIESGRCGDSFTANCTCPNPLLTTTTPAPTTTTTASTTQVYTTVSVPTEPPASSSNTGAIVGGVIGAVLIIIIVIIIIVVIWRKKKQKEQKRPPSTITNKSYGETMNYTISGGVYVDIMDSQISQSPPQPPPMRDQPSLTSRADEQIYDNAANGTTSDSPSAYDNHGFSDVNLGD